MSALLGVMKYLLAEMRESTDPAQGPGQHFVPAADTVVIYTDRCGTEFIVRKVTINPGGDNGSILYGSSLFPDALDADTGIQLTELLASLKFYRQVTH